MNKDVERYYDAREYYDIHDTSTEMEDGQWQFPVDVAEYIGKIGEIPDGYDDYRIDNPINILQKVFSALMSSKTNSLTVEEFSKIVTEELEETYDNNYWEHR